MKSAADIASALLDEPCPHGTTGAIRAGDWSPATPRRRARCIACLTAALTEFGDARARAEREACATLIEQRGSKALNAAVSGATMAYCDLIRARTP